jgi:hypothetical protein
MKCFCFHAALALILVSNLAAQQMNSEFNVAKITPELVTTPEYTFNFGPKGKRVPKNKNWLEVEVSFDWEPSDRKEKFTDDVTIDYFVLLNNASRENPQGTLLMGSVTHVAIAAGKGMNSVMYVSPRSLERFFDGKAPTTVNAAIKDIGVVIKHKGQAVAQSALFSKIGSGMPWWTAEGYSPTAGFVLNKNETPFAPLFWDYYEAVKASPAGM